MTPAKIKKVVEYATEIFDACTKTGGGNDEIRIERAPALSRIPRFQTDRPEARRCHDLETLCV